MPFVLQKAWPCLPLAPRLLNIVKPLEGRAFTDSPACTLRSHYDGPHISKRTFVAALTAHDHVKSLQIETSDISSKALVPSNPLSEYDAEAADIPRKVQAEPYQGWRERLNTFENLEYESDVDAPPSQGKRLVDIDRYRADPDLWIELLRFRRRIRGLEGILPLWNRLKNNRLVLSNSVLRCGVLELGFQRPEVLKQVFRYAEDTYEKTGFRCFQLYFKIVGHFLRTEPWNAYQWHSRLKKNFAPSDEEFKMMFGTMNGNNKQALVAYQKFYKCFRFPQMYGIIIPSLCSQKLHKAALAWHKILIADGDFPYAYSSAEPLLHELALQRREELLLRCTKELVDGGVSFAKSTDGTLKANIFISREKMNRIHGEFYGIAPKTISDEFCARLFATKFFSVDTVIKGLQILGMDTIGPMAMREIALRAVVDGVCNSETVAQHISNLSRAGISTGGSVLSRLIQKLAAENSNQILTDMVHCDLHPEAFEDWKLQESLLASYQAAGDQRQVDRTLAILLLDTDARNTNATRLNFLLRTCLTREHWKEMSQILNTMREQNVYLSSKSCAYLRACVLAPRQVSKRPSTTDELNVIINAFQWTMCAGGLILPKGWVEILRRLGMSGQLDEYEKLALWLARWYTDAAFRASQINHNVDFGAMRNDRIETRLEQLSPRSPLHPCRIIFSETATRAIVAWGFQHSPNMAWYSRLTPEQRASTATSNQAPWTWGLHFLNKLRAHGVWIDRNIVASSCTTRLKMMFGPGLSARRINRQAREHREDDIAVYVGAMERILGNDLFPSSQFRELSFLGRYSRQIS